MLFNRRFLVPALLVAAAAVAFSAPARAEHIPITRSA